MAGRDRYPPQTPNIKSTRPFDSAEEAWFWFIAAQQARADGARFVAGQGDVQRPCEPSDIFQVVNRLYRQRRLVMDHLLVLRHYGRRHMSPDPRRVKEVRAYTLWKEAMNRIEPVLEKKGIVCLPDWFAVKSAEVEDRQKRCSARWVEDMVVYENMEA